MRKPVRCGNDAADTWTRRPACARPGGNTWGRRAMRGGRVR